jgi:hypothetical protein
MIGMALASTFDAGINEPASNNVGWAAFYIAAHTLASFSVYEFGSCTAVILRSLLAIQPVVTKPALLFGSHRCRCLGDEAVGLRRKEHLDWVAAKRPANAKPAALLRSQHRQDLSHEHPPDGRECHAEFRAMSTVFEFSLIDLAVG